MLTRLKVKGFKNLVDVDVYFGPFTCIAGPNGVGKSNVLDAVTFMGALADHTFEQAAAQVRDKHGRNRDISDVFNRVGQDRLSTIDLYAEMLVPEHAEDDLGQPARAKKTFLSYRVVLELSPASNGGRPLRLIHEELRPIATDDAPRKIPFSHSLEWRRGVIKGRRVGPFISTERRASGTVVKLHQDGGGGGRPVEVAADNLPRTVLSRANASESPTALVARREMQSWRLLQLEPSALREPDDFNAPAILATDGAHISATLFRLASSPLKKAGGPLLTQRTPDSVFGAAATRLSELIGGVRSISVDKDEQRKLLTLVLTDLSGTPHPARALSDGTLRFLALTILHLDPEFGGLICLEEPENGIHPERIPAMIQLLKDIAVDPRGPSGEDNPLRQVIATTHSPAVVSCIDRDNLLMAVSEQRYFEATKNDDLKSTRSQSDPGSRNYATLAFRCMPGSWRDRKKLCIPAPLGSVVSYLNASVDIGYGDRTDTNRVVDYPEVRQYLLPFSA